MLTKLKDQILGYIGWSLRASKNDSEDFVDSSLVIKPESRILKHNTYKIRTDLLSEFPLTPNLQHEVANRFKVSFKVPFRWSQINICELGPHAQVGFAHAKKRPFETIAESIGQMHLRAFISLPVVDLVETDISPDRTSKHHSS